MAVYQNIMKILANSKTLDSPTINKRADCQKHIDTSTSSKPLYSPQRHLSKRSRKLYNGLSITSFPYFRHTSLVLTMPERKSKEVATGRT